MRGKVENLPDWVVLPKRPQEVSKIMRFACKEGIPVTPYGGGSGVCGGAIPIRGGIVLDLKRMDEILEINDKALTVTAQPGIIGQDLERELNENGYTLGHFPQSMYCSTVGGWVATRAAGQLSTKYGKIEDILMALEVVLPTGEIVRTKKTPRSSTGPGIMGIFLGSEGTLGIITEATLNIFPYPEEKRMSSFEFKDYSSGLEAIRKIMRTGLRPAVIRLYDRVETQMYFSKIGASKDSCMMIFLFEGNAGLPELEERIANEICMKDGAVFVGSKPTEQWLEDRYNVKALPAFLSKGIIVDTIEVASTWGRVQELNSKMIDSIRKVPRVLHVSSHCSHSYPQGACLYISFGAIPKTPEDAQKLYWDVWDQAMNSCIKAGGTISHHHGIGLVRSKYMKKELGDGIVVLKRIKKALDPANIMNPGKLGI